MHIPSCRRPLLDHRHADIPTAHLPFTHSMDTTSVEVLFQSQDLYHPRPLKKAAGGRAARMGGGAPSASAHSGGGTSMSGAMQADSRQARGLQAKGGGARRNGAGAAGGGAGAAGARQNGGAAGHNAAKSIFGSQFI
jgi:hypothetical protein